MITNLRTPATITRKGPRIQDEAGSGWIDGPCITVKERVAIRAAGTRDLSQAQALEVQINVAIDLRAGAQVERGDIITVNGTEYVVQAVPEDTMPGRPIKSALALARQAGQ